MESRKGGWYQLLGKIESALTPYTVMTNVNEEGPEPDHQALGYSWMESNTPYSKIHRSSEESEINLPKELIKLSQPAVAHEELMTEIDGVIEEATRYREAVTEVWRLVTEETPQVFL